MKRKTLLITLVVVMVTSLTIANFRKTKAAAEEYPQYAQLVYMTCTGWVGGIQVQGHKWDCFSVPYLAVCWTTGCIVEIAGEPIGG
jgi:hypothetical protein